VSVILHCVSKKWTNFEAVKLCFAVTLLRPPSETKSRGKNVPGDSIYVQFKLVEFCSKLRSSTDAMELWTAAWMLSIVH